MSKNFIRVNEKIRISPVFVVKDGKSLGSMPLYKAIQLAKESKLDLIEVAPDSRPPVCKIMEYGKFAYEKKIKERQQRKASKASQVKEIRFSPVIEDHDIETKVKHITEFLTDGHMVILRLQYKNRQMAHKDLGLDVINKVVQKISEFGKLKDQPKMNGRNLIAILEPITKTS
jgi:translation initiation factor IF-3